MEAVIEIAPLSSSIGLENDVYIVLVDRRDPPRLLAIPGGFVNVGESTESATLREVKEETNLDLASIQLFRVYSDPNRDKRRHTVSTIYRCVASNSSMLNTGDDAKATRVVRLQEAVRMQLAFDHQQVLSDYFEFYYGDTKP
jgi:8-oxo-dGTP diphosphatase